MGGNNMPLKRMILEIGMGNDLHGGDYTKAAVRAVEDAVHHSSLSFARSLGLNWDDIQIQITIGVQEPDTIDKDAVKAVLPSGQVSVTAVKGGLNVRDPAVDDRAVIATAAVEVMVELP
jgi:uncharacterized protein (TIGR02058 family)